MLQENFPDLQKLYGQGALSGYLGGQQLDAARKSQQINQQGALQDMFWKDQTTPVDMQYKQALTGQTNETSRGMRFKNDFNDTYKDDVYKREVSRLAKEMNEDDLKSANAQIEKMLYDDSPQVRGIAQMLLSNTKDIIAEREKQKYMLDRQASLEELRGKNAAETARVRNLRTGGVNSLEKALVSGNPNAVAAAYDKMAQDSDDPQERAFYVQKSQEYREIARQQDLARNPGTAPGQVNKGELGVPVNPAAPPVQPPITRDGTKAPPANTDYAKWTMADWKKRYPNATDEQIRAAAKAKGYDPK